MAKILVTGGCGYIGSHTIVDLVEHGHEVISIDNLSRGHVELLEGVNEILGKEIKNYNIDLYSLEDIRAVFEENKDIEGVIHFAAYKSVPESVDNPLMYFKNNIGSLINLLMVCKEYQVLNFVFSSSCSVYGNTDQLPVTETTPFDTPASPYARTKQMGEEICADFIVANPLFNISLLRYFNPVGAHPSCLIGERNQTPENLVPIITQTAIGKREEMTVHGNDYPTHDGTCIRDYIHVCDIAHAHTLALKKLITSEERSQVDIYNLGTGKGISVLELINAFEQAANLTLPYKVGPRRPGDVIEIYANNEKARKELNWMPKFEVKDMMETAWLWEKHLQKIENAPLN